MRVYLSDKCALKRLETPCVYHLEKDELYELDEEAFVFLQQCSQAEGMQVSAGELVDFCLEEGLLLSASPGAVRRPVVEPSPEPSLRYLELLITDRCNLRCRHCYVGPGKQVRELPLQRILQALDEFERMQGLRVMISGGEPLLHREFSALNDALQHYAFRRVLFTNGADMGERILEGLSLRLLNVHEIQFSIDGLQQGHDYLRGAGTYERTMAALQRAQAAGYEVSVSTMVHRGNLGEFDAMGALFEGLGVRDWTVDIPSVAGNLRGDATLVPPPETAGQYLRYGFGEGLHGGGSGHACGYHLMAVLPDGALAKCGFYGNQAVGNLSTGDGALRNAWGKIPRPALEDLQCRECADLQACRGGCRYRGGRDEDFISKDLYKCVFYGRI